MLWKMLEGDTETPISHHDDSKWVVGEWRDVHVEYDREWGCMGPRVEACEFGFHASPTLVEAFMYVEPGVIALVEVDGDSDTESDRDYGRLEVNKSAHERMRLVRVWQWTEEDYKALAEKIGELEAKYGQGDRYYSYPDLLLQIPEGVSSRYQQIVSVLLDRRMSGRVRNMVNKWWEKRLTRLG